MLETAKEIAESPTEKISPDLSPYLNRVVCGDALEIMRGMPDGSVHMVVTSPPYWFLRNYGVDGMIGLEPTLDQFMSNLVNVFREVRRVLRDDGVCWVNVGVSYAANRSYQVTDNKHTDVGNNHGSNVPFGYKPKDLIPQPWLLGMALMQDGWWLRSEVIWSKKNPMPGSQQDRPTTAHETILMLTKSARYAFFLDQVRENHKDKKVVNGIYIGSGINKSEYDEKQRSDGISRPPIKMNNREYNPNGRAIRTVWTFATEPMGWQMCKACGTVYAPDEYRRLKDRKLKFGAQVELNKICRTCKLTNQWLSHFAAYPQELVRRCILASTSNKGVCSKCGAQWMPEVELTRKPRGDRFGCKDNSAFDHGQASSEYMQIVGAKITGYSPSCKCNAPTAPPLILDPFLGSGTTGLTASKLGRDFIGIDLNHYYCRMAEERIKRETQQLNMFHNVRPA